MSLRRTVRGQVRVTGFLGRTKVGDVVQMYVTRERRRLLSRGAGRRPGGRRLRRGPHRLGAEGAHRPRTCGCRGTGASARTSGACAWRATAPRRLAGGRHRDRWPTHARAPARRARTGRSWRGSSRATAARRSTLALPGPPALAVTPGTLPADGAATVTVTGAEPAGEYEVDAEWTCPATGATGRRQGLEPTTRWARPPGGTLTGVLDASGVNFGLFDEACAGPAPPEALPATLVLYRFGVGRGGGDHPRAGRHRRRLGRPARLTLAAGRGPGAGGMVPAMNIVISGGGMVGMTLAHLLRLRGFSPVVIERQREGEYMPRGYMLGFQGYEPLEEVGVFEEVRDAGRPIAPRDGQPPVAVAVRFGALIEALARDLPVVYEHTVVDLIRDGDDRVVGVEVEGPDGRTTIDSDLVVACDGVMSPDAHHGRPRRDGRRRWPTGRSRG